MLTQPNAREADLTISSLQACDDGDTAPQETTWFSGARYVVQFLSSMLRPAPSRPEPEDGSRTMVDEGGGTRAGEVWLGFWMAVTYYGSCLCSVTTVAALVEFLVLWRLKAGEDDDQCFSSATLLGAHTGLPRTVHGRSAAS
eukprot:SAG11_NODE_427_length_9558_cov_4.909398_4_plen_142_part_00